MDRATMMLTTIALTLAFLSSVEGQLQPEIANIILPVIKRVGETGMLNCTVTKQSDAKVYWIYKASSLTLTLDDSLYVDDNLNEIIDGNRKYDIMVTKHANDQKTYSLIVRRLQRDDAGKYTCKIHLKGSDDDPKKDGEMVVLVSPTITKGTTTQVAQAEEGGNVTMNCYADGYPPPKIIWVRGNGLSLPEPVNAFRFRGNVMKLRNIKAEDAGVFRCLANNDVNPPASLDTTLHVQYRPTSLAVQSSYGQAQNRQFRVTIECIITGFPEPDLQWWQEEQSKSGWKKIRNDDKHMINVITSHGGSLSVNSFWFQLVIINVQANDYARYRCEGYNRKGSSYATIRVYETSECQGANCPPETVVGSSNCHKMSALVLILSSLISYIFTLGRQ